MNASRFQRVAELFEEGRQVAPGKREAWLEEQCGGDAALREEVRELLAHHDAAANPLDEQRPGEIVDQLARSMAAGEANAGGDEARRWMPESLGHFRIIDILGEGGMGTVFEAEQERPKRRVALKVIRAGFGSHRLYERFKHEADILAQLEHPGIGRIYEFGEAETKLGPQPYFAMELVRGRSLTEHAEHEGLATRERLGLFARICDAVQYAHGKGVVHRDLKPDNIIVDASGAPKILDFGVARVLDAEDRATMLRTMSGQVLGTLPYMSPEQVSGEPEAIDVRSDVYSLGVVLYELLAGRLPYEFRKKTLAETARVIENEDPRRLSSIDRRFRGDLETIVGKALAKEPDRRYPTAAALADDVRRYLNDEPIAARPATTSYQLRKFARRHRAVVAGSIAVLLMLVLGLIGTSVGLLRAQRAEEAAVEQRDRAIEARDESEELARFFTNLLGTGGASRPDEQVTVLEMLDRTAPLIDIDFADRPLVRWRLHAEIGRSYSAQHRFDDAEKHLLQAREGFRSMLGAVSERGILVEQLLAALRRRQGRHDEAVRISRDAATASERTWGPEARITIESNWMLGRCLYQAQQFGEAADLLEDLRPIADRVLGPESNFAMGVLRFEAKSKLALDRDEEAVGLLEEVVERRRRSQGEMHPATMVVTADLGGAYLKVGDYDRAVATFEALVEHRRSMLGPDHPQTKAAERDLVEARRNIIPDGR